MIRLFVGLGNPGPEYESTRHNAGFWWTDALAEQLGARLVPERAYQALAARVTGVPGADGPIWLLQPMTYMNRSGVSVAALARFFKIEPSEVLVVHDELDVQPGQAKLKFGGSSGGHNGLKDIQGMLGTADYWRLRLGIGHPGVKSEVIHYVLQKPSALHREAIEKATEQSLKAIPALLAGQMDKALAIIHAQPPRPKPPRPAPGLAPGPASGSSSGTPSSTGPGTGSPHGQHGSPVIAKDGAPPLAPTEGASP